MGVINVLDPQTANLIAAGEVVDRPASALKELMENAVDSGATSIAVEIKNGGVSFMRVTDNGCGIAREDVPTAILRHATSKIRTQADLNAIGTLGFRGEALAAIASVSKLRILTKPRDEELGTLLRAENGEVTEVSDAGCQSGTTVIVEELFANIPARRKFLKKDSSETLAAAAVVEKIAISRPDISFKFITDGNMRFNTSGDGKLSAALYAVLGREFTHRLLEISFVTGGIELSGYVGQPDNVRSNRNFQNFFINARYVKCRTASAALEEAFSSYIPADKFPVCVLNIGILPAYVDVNVHPAKLEVKFSNEHLVFDAVYCAVRNALVARIERPELAVPSVRTADDVRLTNAFVPVNDRINDDSDDKNDAGEKEPEKSAPRGRAPEKLTFDVSFLTSEDISPEGDRTAAPQATTETPVRSEQTASPEPRGSTGPAALPEPDEASLLPPRPKPFEAPPAEDTAAFSAPPVEAQPSHAPRREEKHPLYPEYRMIGEAFNSYVLVELADRVLVIDKHAAHERIIFETMKRNMQSGKVTSQILLLPYRLQLSGAEYAALCEYSDEIKACGFGFELEPENNTAVMLQYPAELEQGEAADMLTGLAGKLADGSGSVATERNEMYERALYQASCKAAIKAGRIYDVEHIKWLCERLLEMPDIKFCPHGRPVAFELTKSELERQFKRT